MFTIKYQDIEGKESVTVSTQYESKEESIAVADSLLKHGRWVIVYDQDGHSVYSDRM